MGNNGDRVFDGEFGECIDAARVARIFGAYNALKRKRGGNWC